MLTWPRVGPWLSIAISLFTIPATSQAVPPSNIDFQSLGQVAVAGNFDALSIYQYAGQRQGFSSNGTQAVLTQLPSGFYEMMASTDGGIHAMCPFVLKNGTLVGVMVGGNFTSIGGVDTRSVALINPTTGQITPQVGIQGSVNALLCDKDTETVYVGGTFDASISSNAITWVAAGSWADLPFTGFDAPVTSIVKETNGNIVFGGSFTGLGNTTDNTTQTPQANQVINLVTASITSTANTTSGNNIVCPPSAGSSSATPWLLQDNTAGSWQADLRYGFQPARLRLWNTNQNGRGTKTWRLTALPDGGIMNFTYTDPATGHLATCDAQCPLSNNASVPYQDFDFVNTVGMNSIRLDVSDWYGSGGGLAGIQLYQSDIFVYAVEAFNEPTCSNSTTPSDVTTTGTWYSTPSRNSNADYLTVVTGPTTVDSTQIVFQPDVKQSGNYSVTVFTPGCIQDSSCSARGTVNVTGTLTSTGGTVFSTMLSQTNNFDKYDQVYQGHIDAASSAFRPSVTLRASGDIPAQLIVASRVQVKLVTSTGGLNGLYEYDPNNATINTDFGQSAINSAGNRLKADAQVLALVSHNNTIYAAGQFTDDTLQNVLAFANNQISPLPNGGLNAAVMTMYSDDQNLYCGGNFTGTNQQSTSGLNNIASYQYSSSSWVALGAGVDGQVNYISPLPMNLTSNGSEEVITVSGDFQTILADGDYPSIPVDGFAIWVPSRKAWLQNLNNVSQQAFSGQLAAFTELSNGTWLGAGTLTSLGESVRDVATLSSAQSGYGLVQQIPVQISGNSSSSAAGTLVDQTISGVTTGLYYAPNNGARNVTVLAGYFNATGTNSTPIANLAFLDYSRGNAVTGLPSGIDSNSSFFALANQNDILIAGGRITGEVNTTGAADSVSINGLVMYDFSASAYRSPQPAALVGEDVVVNAITVQPGTSSVYVAGSFDTTTQGLSCSSICMYDLTSSTWNTVGGQLGGTVVGLYWTTQGTSQLIAAGNLTVSGNSTSLAVYNPQQKSWTAKASSAIPGPVSAFGPAKQDGSRVWVAGTASNGSTYLMQVDGSTYRSVYGFFQPGTTIASLQLVPLSTDHGKSDYFQGDSGHDLLVSGNLNITGYGQAATALFNGTTMTPFILASTSSGASGSVSKLFSSNGMSLSSNTPKHSRGIAVLVALCAALGTIFLIILCGILLNYIQRRRAGYSTVPAVPYTDKHSNINRVPPERLFGTLGQRPGGAPTV